MALTTEQLVLLVVGFLGLTLIAGAILYLTKQGGDTKDGGGAGGGGRGARRRRGGGGGGGGEAKDGGGGDDDGQDGGAFELTEQEEAELAKLKPGSKKRKRFLDKLEKKRRRAAQRDHERQQQEARQTKRSAAEDKYAKREAEREAKEQKRREAAAEAKRIADAQAEEEFDDWKDMFETTEAGTEKLSADEAESQLEQFVKYIKRKKVVLLEDLATEFGLSAQAAVDRVTKLEEMGSITGVIDDRGKFIYVSPEEMQQVADFIKRRGRVSISELVRESNALIDLTEREDDDAEEEAAATGNEGGGGGGSQAANFEIETTASGRR